MSAFAWDAYTRAFWRDEARRHPHGIAATLAGLSDLLDAAEARAARVDALVARLDAVDALHRPEATDDGRLVCSHCPWVWPCPTAEALTGLPRSPVPSAPTPTHQPTPASAPTTVSGPAAGIETDTTGDQP